MVKYKRKVAEETVQFIQLVQWCILYSCGNTDGSH